MLILIWLTVGLWLSTSPAAQALTAAQQRVHLTQANRAFEQAVISPTPQAAQAAYRQAIAEYEQLIAAGVQNATLHYNLGNAYFRVHDLGRAILAYRRGVRLDPGNRQLQANLRYARSQRVDQIEAPTQRSVWSHVFFWQDVLSVPTQWTLALLGYSLAWGGALAQRYRRHPGWRWGIVASALCCGMLATSAWLLTVQHTATQAGVIIADEVAVRKGNGESYTLQLPQPLHPGTEFLVLEVRGSWLAIQLDNGISGWIRHDSAALL